MALRKAFSCSISRGAYCIDWGLLQSGRLAESKHEECAVPGNGAWVTNR